LRWSSCIAVLAVAVDPPGVVRDGLSGRSGCAATPSSPAVDPAGVRGFPPCRRTVAREAAPARSAPPGRRAAKMQGTISPYFGRDGGRIFPISVPRKTLRRLPGPSSRPFSTEYPQIRQDVGGGQVYITAVQGSFSPYLAENRGPIFPAFFSPVPGTGTGRVRRNGALPRCRCGACTRAWRTRRRHVRSPRRASFGDRMGVIGGAP